MKIHRLTRLLHLLTLTRRTAFHTLRGVRLYFFRGQRARGLRTLRSYRLQKADIERLHRQVLSMLSALIRPVN